MKKKLLLLLTAVLAILCMAGCGSDRNSKSGKSDDKSGSKTYKVGIVQYVEMHHSIRFRSRFRKSLIKKERNSE